MQFFTHINIPPFAEKIDYRSLILSLGSCFAENIAMRLCDAKFHIITSPSGILFNPESIAMAIDNMAAGRTPKQEDLLCNGDVWFNYDFHSSFSSCDKDAALHAMQKAMRYGSWSLHAADTLIITFGSAWVYRHKQSGKVVANCHKQPASEFCRELLSAEEIVSRWSSLLQSVLSKKIVIFTVSPIRHLSDGLEHNSLSKATLRVAIAQLCSEFSNALYFPSYEIMNDELRDYRFYGEDMIHPSPTAIDYIWSRFCNTAISESALATMQRIEKLNRAAAHRPFNPQSDSHRQFCRKWLMEIAMLQNEFPEMDLEKEKAHFFSHL